ncbi:unnamed protein product [Rhodiola kirilowii]
MVPVKSAFRLIAYSEEIVNGEPIYVASNCLPKKALKYEPAGHSFHEAALRLRGFFEEDKDDEDEEQKPSAGKEQYMPSSGSYSTKSKKKSGSDSKEQDHYALLNLSHLRYLATEEQIRKSYRETALKYHPDKQAALLLTEETEAGKEAKKEEIEAHFKSVQEAYELLMDPVKRRIYDSTDEFDDEIPTDCAPQDFFKVFGPAFMRNGRWSVAQPVPSLGNDNASLKEVDDFYNFWYSFKSWREFPHEDEHDLEQAESRDHKRWMERQNAKLSEKARKEEYVRIRSLVENSYKRDPRIVRRKEEEKAEKQKKKQAKYLAKQLEEEKAAKEAEEERRRKEEEDKHAAETNALQKKAKEKEKKLLRKERSRLRSLSASVVSHSQHHVTQDDIEGLCMSLGMDDLKNLCDNMEGMETKDQAETLRNILGRKAATEGVTQDEKKPSLQNGSATQNGTVHLGNYEKKEKEKPWAKEEVELLKKGVQKYPKGTSRRWEVISEYIGTGRSVDEILKATKTVLLQKPDSNKAFDSFLEKKKPSPSIQSPLSTRDDIVDMTPSAAGDSSGTGETEQKPEQAVANGLPSSSDPDQWSAVQEKALIQALKTFPKDASQRWERVATAVPGKTVHQCKKKFALLKESFRSNKS